MYSVVIGMKHVRQHFTLSKILISSRIVTCITIIFENADIRQDDVNLVRRLSLDIIRSAF
jgi:hypothetical protein